MTFLKILKKKKPDEEKIKAYIETLIDKGDITKESDKQEPSPETEPEPKPEQVIPPVLTHKQHYLWDNYKGGEGNKTQEQLAKELGRKQGSISRSLKAIKKKLGVI